MKLSSTQLTDKPLFPLKNTLIDSFDDVLSKIRFDIDHDNQTDISLEQQTALSEIEALDQKLLQHFHSKIKLQPSLTRQLVSFQANKSRPSYRWYKYKEAFSASLIEYLLSKYGITSGKALDPFAGSGTTLFAASAYGLDAEGIELLSIGQHIISARKCLEREFTKKDFASLNRWITEHPWHKTKVKKTLPCLRITDGAYPKETLKSIEQYIGAWQQQNERVRLVLRFALLCTNRQQGQVFLLAFHFSIKSIPQNSAKGGKYRSSIAQ